MTPAFYVISKLDIVIRIVLFRALKPPLNGSAFQPVPILWKGIYPSSFSNEEDYIRTIANIKPEVSAFVHDKGMIRFEKQAEADRQEIRDAVGRIGLCYSTT